MGVLRTVFPLDERMKRYLDSRGVRYPLDSSRLPTGHEIKTALGRLKGYDVKLYDNGLNQCFQADICSSSTDEWTLLNVSEYSGDDQQQELWFEKGHESAALSVLKLLTSTCGPLTLFADTGEDPIVVTRDD